MATIEVWGTSSDDDMTHQVAADESEALSASPIACAVADAWAQHGNRPPSVTFDSPLWSALDALEAATRESPLRKVRP